eukprot:1136816-Pelagomonas_calceolata.AAC.6
MRTRSNETEPFKLRTPSKKRRPKASPPKPKATHCRTIAAAGQHTAGTARPSRAGGTWTPWTPAQTTNMLRVGSQQGE